MTFVFTRHTFFHTLSLLMIVFEASICYRKGDYATPSQASIDLEAHRFTTFHYVQRRRLMECSCWPTPARLSTYILMDTMIYYAEIPILYRDWHQHWPHFGIEPMLLVSISVSVNGPYIYVSLRLRVQNWTTKWHFPLNFRTVAYPELLLNGLSFRVTEWSFLNYLIMQLASTLYYHV